MQPEHYATLERILSTYCPLTPLELTALLPNFRLRRVARKDFLLAGGTVCNFWGFVHCGLLRVYANTAQGTEHTSWFVREGDFVTEYNAFTTSARARKIWSRWRIPSYFMSTTSG